MKFVKSVGSTILPGSRYASITTLLVFLALWINGKFYPLILLPFLFIRFVLGEGPTLIGFRRENLQPSLALGVFSGLLVLATYYPVHIYYLNLRADASLSLGAMFTDLVWYPFYEEVSYRGFFLGVFAGKSPPLSGRNLTLNLIQALMFVSVHHHHVSAGLPLLLIPIFLLGFLNGLVFLRSQSIAGCILAHVLVNGITWLLLISPVS